MKAMKAKEVRQLANNVIDYELCNDKEIDQLCHHILDTVNDDDDKPLTKKTIVRHAGYQQLRDDGDEDGWDWCMLGDFQIDWCGEDEFDIYHENETLYPQPRTWGELRYLAKMLNAKLEIA